MGKITLPSVLKNVLKNTLLYIGVYKQYFLSTLLMVSVAFSVFGQSIPATNGAAPTGVDGNGNCWNCAPAGWTDAGGTPDISNSTTASSSDAAPVGSPNGGGATWVTTIPNPPNNHDNWLSLRDLGAGGTEETVSANITGLTPGNEYEVVVYALTQISNDDTGNGPGIDGYYAGAFNDQFRFDVDGGTIVTVPFTGQNVWNTSRLRFTATAATSIITIYPGNNSAYTGSQAGGGNGRINIETVQVSVTLNAINTVPDAVDDMAGYIPGSSVTFDIVGNDSDAEDTTVVTASVDLDPSTAGQQTTVTNAQGTWVYNTSSGEVTFTPATGFNGTATLNYTVEDNNSLDGTPAPATSSPALITVSSNDQDGDGVPDASDICPGSDDTLDADMDGVPDGCDSDDDNDGVPDDVEYLGFTTVSGSTSADCTAPALDFENNGNTEVTYTDADFSGDFSVSDTWRYDGVLPNVYVVFTATDATAGTTLVEFDDDTSGFPASFNPRVSYTFNGGGTITTGYFEFLVEFFDTTTNNPVSIEFGGSSYDMDGQVDGTNGTGESQLFFGVDAYVIEGPIAPATTPNISAVQLGAPNPGVEFTAGALQGAAIDTDPRLRGYFNYNGTDSFVVRLQYKEDGNFSNRIRQFSFGIDKCTAVEFQNPLLTIINGVDTDGDGVDNHLDLDSDNDGIYDLVESGSGASDGDNDGVVDGPVGANGLPDQVETNPNTDGEIDYTVTNTDGDLTPGGGNQYNFIDQDSDNDSCSDANEYFNDNNADGGDGGSYGTGEPQLAVDMNGLVTTAPYNNSGGEDSDTNGTSDYVEGSSGTPFPNPDGDTDANACDTDDDNDGNPDATDPNTQVPTATDDPGNTATGGAAEVIQILGNDDFTDNTDGNADPDNNDPISVTTIETVIGANTTATGTIAYDPATGELTYTPTFAEGGTTVTIEYQVCNDVNGDSPGTTTDDVCDTAIVTIDVAFGDSDGDGVPDNLDQCPGFDDNADNDGDGVADGCDEDDDNDGIADLTENNGNFAEGDEDGDGILNYLDTTDDDPGNTVGDGSTTDYTDADGNGIPDVYDFDGDSVANHLDVDADNDGIYDVAEAGGTDADNDGIADGIDSDGNGIPDSAGTGLTPTDSGPTPGTPDYLDFDSDEDSCSDANEAYNDDTADGGDGGQYGTDPAPVNPDGTVIAASYPAGTTDPSFPNDTDGNGTPDHLEDGPDPDNDTIANACDEDDDGDGNPDDNEIANGNDPLTPVAVDDNGGVVIAGVPEVIQILDNDDFLNNNDPNNVGNTIIYNAGTGTAQGVISFDPATGELTYTASQTELGTTVTVDYTVCNDVNGDTTFDANGNPTGGQADDICDVATVTIMVADIPDSDGDGVNDFVDLDDDNDGILDSDETPAGFPDPSGDQDNDGVPNYLDPDLVEGFTDANGDGVNDAYDFDGDGVPNSLDLDADNDGIYDVTETGGTDDNNDGLADDTDGDPTNNNGIPNTAGTGNTPINSGTDPATLDFLDLDSDEDGCSDANEYFNGANADGGDGGQYGVGDPLTLAGGGVDANGAVTTA
ncbi:beta strand repeat-containing protein, partial [Marinirhabdus gelatinilytica]